MSEELLRQEDDKDDVVAHGGGHGPTANDGDDFELHGGGHGPTANIEADDDESDDVEAHRRRSL
jgi:hypothetical protein